MTYMEQEGSPAVTAEEVGRPGRGRPRDRSRDADILQAALHLLADVGAHGFTMDLVAERAGAGKATIYRRWPSKAALVVDAVAFMKREQVNIEALPDTGSLRGDLLALFKPETAKASAQKLRTMSALAAMIADDAALAGELSSVMVQPWAEAHRALMHRAMGRGEISATADIETLCQIVPSLAAYRALVQRLPFTREFLVALIDGAILPALRHTAGDASKTRAGR